MQGTGTPLRGTVHFFEEYDRALNSFSPVASATIEKDCSPLNRTMARPLRPGAVDIAAIVESDTDYFPAMFLLFLRRYCSTIERALLIVQYSSNPAGQLYSSTTNITGMNFIIAICCCALGSAGLGIIR